MQICKNRLKIKQNSKRVDRNFSACSFCTFCTVYRAYFRALLQLAILLTVLYNNTRKQEKTSDRKELDQFLTMIDDDNNLTGRQYYNLRHEAISKFYEED